MANKIQNFPALQRQVKLIGECAKSAGMWDVCFLGFGSCLGIVRDGGFIQHDPDADICFLADRVTVDQEETFYKNLISAGLYKYREYICRRKDTNRLLWTSVKGEKHGMKTCIWFQQRYKGLYWHGKNKTWVEKIGPHLKPPVFSGDSILKGIPQELLEVLVDANLYDQIWKIPARYGECLDFWYPGWKTPRIGVCSKASYHLIVGEWKNEASWKIRKD